MRTLILALCVAIAACSNESKPHEKRVAILKLGTHELIDQVEQATIASLTKEYGNKIKISQYNGNFQPETIRLAVTQIVHSDFDVAIPITTSATAELVNAADGKPNIVFSFVSNPEEVWGKDKKRPDFVTGTSDQLDYEKNVSLIRALYPKAKVIGYLVNESEPNAKDGLRKMKDIAPRFGFTLHVAGVSSTSDVNTAARSIIGNVDVFLVGGDNTVVGGLGGLLAVADDKRVPVFAVENTSVKVGALAAYGVDYAELGQATAQMVLQVLKGASPSSIPVNYFSKTKLFINKKTAQKLNVDSSKLADATFYE